MIVLFLLQQLDNRKVILLYFSDYEQKIFEKKWFLYVQWSYTGRVHISM